MTGTGLDVGYSGGVEGAVPILPGAVGVGLGYPGYDGKTLPFPDNSQDYIFTSHVLEHIPDYKHTIRDWHRVVKSGGCIVIIVPHQFLYEKRARLPSVWNQDHQRFYTPASLLKEIEESLSPNSYRIVHLRDNDDGFIYDISPENHSSGCYEIECVVRKIDEPAWHLA
jgi:ubiquinone/menaquinone biosynthesis C-methylase UbiE